MHVVVPAFMISEVATGFKIGFIVYLPFIVVDLVITNVIMALGMQQLQTQSLAPPFKVLIFSLANGWHLLIEALVRSYR
jgi:type III secretion protein R